MKRCMKNSMLVPWESWWHLEDISYRQRSGKQHTDKQKERMKRQFENFAIYDGMKKLLDYDLGGAVGNPEKSYEEGRWTRWSCEDMKKILDEAGLSWKQGKLTEITSV